MHRRTLARTCVRTTAFTSALAVALIALGADAAAPAKPVKPRSWLTGNAADSPRQPLGGPGLLLMGGSTEVDAGFAQRAFPIANGGDIVILRTSGRDGYNDYLYTLVSGPLKPDSVETLLVDTRDKANSDYTDRAIRQAELIFLAGGDQSTYVNAWQGTRVQDALHYAHARGAVIGGTSAGLAVLGQHVYDPDGVDGVITDSHFHERDRMGRTLAFMARLRQDGIAPSITAVAIDEQTSLFIDRNGRGIVDSNLGGAVYVISERTDTVRERVAPGQPLIYRNLQRVRLRAGQWYDFVARTHAGDSTTLSVDGRNAAPFTPTDPY